MKTDNNAKPDSIVMEPDTTYSALFWDEDGVAIGDYDLFFIGDEEYSTSSIEGLKEWFMQADKYDPYTDIAEFTTEGMEEWINQGYEYAKKICEMIPKDIKIYYGYWHQFGDGDWKCCKAYLPHKLLSNSDKGDNDYKIHKTLVMTQQKKQSEEPQKVSKIWERWKIQKKVEIEEE